MKRCCKACDYWDAEEKTRRQKTDYYKDMSHEQLLKHVQSYAESIHTLSNEVTRLRTRIASLTKHREMITKSFAGNL